MWSLSPETANGFRRGVMMNQRIRISSSFLTALGVILWLSLTLGTGAKGQSQGSTNPASDTPSQNPETASQNQDNKNAGEGGVVGEANAPAPPNVTALGSASPLPLPNGSLRWGDFFVRDFAFAQIYDDASYSGLATGTTASGVGISSNTSLFQTDLVYNHMLRYGQFAVQYEPRLAIINGNVYPDYSNQTLGLNFVTAPTARWTVGFSDTLTYLSSRNIYASFYVDADAQTGASIQNNFLDGPGSLLSEAVGVTASYHLSPRLTLDLSPRFSYLRTAGLQLGEQISRDYSGTIGLRYQLTARQTVGVFFGTQYIGITGVPGYTPIYSMGVNYSRQMGPGWILSGAIAATRNPAGAGSPWTVTGNVSLVRDFRYFSTGVVFTRDIATGYVTDDFANRVDGFVNWKMTRMLQWQTSLGAQRGTGTANPISAYYGVTEFDLRLAPRVVTYLNYGYRLQNGDDVTVFTGHRNFVSGGIRWESSPPGAY
jgi:hypothetical protein